MPYKDPEVRRAKAREQSKIWYAANTEVARARRRTYNKSEAGKDCNKRYKKTDNGRLAKRAKQSRRRSALGKHTAADLRLIEKAQQSLCFYCASPAPLLYGRVDHFIPIALGGSNERFNLVLSCDPCNSQKHALHPAAFMKEVGQFPIFWCEYSPEFPWDPHL